MFCLVAITYTSPKRERERERGGGGGGGGREERVPGVLNLKYVSNQLNISYS